MSLKLKFEQRGTALLEARTLVDAADAEKRSMSAEEEVIYNRALADVEKLSADIEMETRLLEQEAKISRVADVENIIKASSNAPKGDMEVRKAVFQKYLKRGINGLTDVEQRSLDATTDANGAYTVPDEQFVAQLIKDVDNIVVIRGLATKFQLTKAASLGFPTLSADPADADWTTELLTGDPDSTMAFGKREFTPSPLAKKIKISRTLINRSPLPIENIVRERMAYKFGITEEKAYMTGNGTGAPLGVFTASADGIDTDRDVSTANTSTAITFDGLINAKYSLTAPHMANASWIFHRDALKMLAKIKDDDGKYIWNQSVVTGQPDALLGSPFFMSEYAPNTFTASQYVGILGDFKYYWIVDALDMQIQVLYELYAETNQIGYICRKEGDGMPILGSAFARVKLAASS